MPLRPHLEPLMGWGEGSTRAWRKTRAHVLDRDGHTCRLSHPGCTGEATEVHHTTGIAQQGTRRRDAINPDDCIATCSPCHAVETQKQRQQPHRSGRRKPRPHPADANTP